MGKGGFGGAKKEEPSLGFRARLRRSLIAGLILYAFYLVVISLFRGSFIAVMREYLAQGTTASDVWRALFVGLRLSMKTAGALTLATWGPATLVAIFSRRVGRSVLSVLSAAAVFVLAVLFMARFPFYRQFHSGFNQLVFNTGKDDVLAILTSVTETNQPLQRVFAAGLITAALAWLLRSVLRATFRHGRLDAKRPLFDLWLLTLAWLVCRLSYFGGAPDWDTELTWENAGVTRDALLNEAILDDPQALWRGYILQERLLSSEGLAFTAADVRRLAAKLTGKPEGSDDLDSYLTRTAGGAQVKKPSHVFLVIGESFANWPLLDKYEPLHIADGMRALLAGEDAAYTGTLLPNGGFTVSAVTGIVAGLADANLYLTTLPEALAAPYPTAAAPVMARLGYEPHFWYAGPATWERIGEFVTAQGFSRFKSRGDYPDAKGNVWGVEDEYLYDAVLREVKPETPGFHVILNASNHVPYTVDLEAKGFDAERTRAALPEEARKDEALLRALGHYWYEDRELARFIRAAREKCPDALFVVIGDHADRYNIDKTPTKYERFTVPFIVIGPGVTKSLLPQDAAGSQIDVMPTVVEMIAPAGFPYVALGESLTRTAKRGVNYMLFIARDTIGEANRQPFAAERFDGTPAALPDEAAMADYIDAVRAVSWYRAKYGGTIRDEIPAQ